MAIDDIIKEPLGLIKVSQVVLLVISIGCVFGPANGWWYYVGATLIAAFLNTIIMLICYFWKQSFEKSFLELSYTSYFVVALFISAILLFTQPQYAQAPWKQTEPTESTTAATLQTTTEVAPTNATTITTQNTTPTSITSRATTEPPTTTPPTTTPPTTTPPTTTPPTTSLTPPTTVLTTTPTTTASPTTTTETPPPTTTEPSTTSEGSDNKAAYMLNSMNNKLKTQNTTPTQSTTSTIPPGPEIYSKEGPWIAGGVFCIFLVLTYSAEIYFITRRLVT